MKHNNSVEQTLGQIGRFQAGFGFPVELQGRTAGDLPFAKVGDISAVARSGHDTIYTANHYIDRDELRKLGAKTVPEGTIVFAKIGEAIRQNFRAITGREMLIDNNAMGLVPNKSVVDPRYLFHFMKQVDMYPLAGSTTVPAIRKSTLEAIRIPLPPMPEQKRIADILDKADAIRRKRQQACDELASIRVAAFDSFFGDPVQNTQKWNRQPLCEVLESIDSGISPKCLDRPVAAGEWGILKLGAVTWCEYDYRQNKALPETITPDPSIEVKCGDLLFTRKNTYELVAAVAFVYQTLPKLMLPDLIFRLRIKQNAAVLPEYLWGLMTYPTKRRQVQALAGGSAGSMPNISKAKLMQHMVELPPDNVQRAYANVLNVTRKISEGFVSAREDAGKLFDALVQRAFRGEL
jgi:type I restriction enzyme S subunit